MRAVVCLLLLCFLLLPGAASAVQLRPGDLLFVTAARSGLSGAIRAATATETSSYDHVALVAGEAPGQVVLHADADGSREQSLASFLADARSKGRRVDAYRLDPAHAAAVPAAIAKARTLLGRPYNATYVQDEGSLYCSDFIERAFRADRVFATQPMNFKDRKTGEFPAFWVDFYRERGMAVPQGQPGTNPNDMAATPALHRMGTVR